MTTTEIELTRRYLKRGASATIALVFCVDGARPVYYLETGWGEGVRRQEVPAEHVSALLLGVNAFTLWLA